MPRHSLSLQEAAAAVVVPQEQTLVCRRSRHSSLASSSVFSHRKLWVCRGRSRCSSWWICVHVCEAYQTRQLVCDCCGLLLVCGWEEEHRKDRSTYHREALTGEDRDTPCEILCRKRHRIAGHLWLLPDHKSCTSCTPDRAKAQLGSAPQERLNTGDKMDVHCCHSRGKK